MKVANIIIDDSFLNGGKLSARLLSQIMDCFPPDATLYSVFDDMVHTFLKFECPQFKDTLPGFMIPEIIVTFTSTWGLTCVDNVDFTNVLDAGAWWNKIATPPSGPSTAFQNGNTSITLPSSGSIQYIIGNQQLQGTVTSPQGMYFDPGDDGSTVKTDNKNVCQHEWQDYVGLSETFRFCKKCNIKEST